MGVLSASTDRCSCLEDSKPRTLAQHASLDPAPKPAGLLLLPMQLTVHHTNMLSTASGGAPHFDQQGFSPLRGQVLLLMLL